MYATAHDSHTDQTGGAAAGWQPSLPATTGDRQQRIPAPRRPADDHGRRNDVTRALEHQPEAADEARHIAESVLEDWQVDAEAVDAAVLVVSELVTNAVEHAQPPIAFHLHREHTGNRLWVGVTDGGPAQQEGARTASCADDERGITIIDTIAEAHGTRTHPTGNTTHWARLNAA
ncbi:ATP-binding protein [Streptomyces sp. NPDC060027]|uniref:ATP-binding protein n=1 Tax=Streptomyces sp. NPDC060027 TaxID=3347040 RepID=UPI00368CEF45